MGVSRELANVSQSAAVAVYGLLGCGDPRSIDRAARLAMRGSLEGAAFACRIARNPDADERPTSWPEGERLGAAEGQELDISICPVSASSAAAENRRGVLSAIAAAPSDSMLDTGPLLFMDKLVVAKVARDRVSLDMPLDDLVRTLAELAHKAPGEVSVAILDHAPNGARRLELEATGARVSLLEGSDLSALISVALGNGGFDALVGIGSINDSVIGASAISMLGGRLLGKLWPRNPLERARALELGLPLDRVLNCDDLVGQGDLAFAATGATACELLPAPSAYRDIAFHSIGIERHGRDVHMWRRQSVASD